MQDNEWDLHKNPNLGQRNKKDAYDMDPNTVS